MSITSVRATIRGRVQGVWFRGWTVETATKLDLAGWVRNKPDGSVEATFSGPAENVDAMLAATWHGPPMARVDDVTTEPCDPPSGGEFREVR